MQQAEHFKCWAVQILATYATMEQLEAHRGFWHWTTLMCKVEEFVYGDLQTTSELNTKLAQFLLRNGNCKQQADEYAHEHPCVLEQKMAEVVTSISHLHDVKFGQAENRCQDVVDAISAIFVPAGVSQQNPWVQENVCAGEPGSLFCGDTVEDHATSTTPPSVHDGCDQNNLVCAGAMMVRANNPYPSTWASGDISQSGFVVDAAIQVPSSAQCSYYLLDDEGSAGAFHQLS